jgi:hypothetical protein
MWRLLKTKLDLGFLVNPFYLYCVAFSLSIFFYLWGWSNIFPKLSAGLILFLSATFIPFILAGNLFVNETRKFFIHPASGSYLYDLMFWLIILLCLINIFYMGYLPILDRTHNYREFGMPVIDPLVNSLSIFFSISFLHSFLETREKKYLIYFFIILLIQFLLFRRSTLMWIFIASTFLLTMHKKKISLLTIVLCLMCIPLLSYSFGLYGNTRSKLTTSFVIKDLGASDAFKSKGISHNHYMTYLYISSPLANLQENIDKRNKNLNKNNFRDFLFYCVVPESFTLRLEKLLHLLRPSCYLIVPELIVGTFYMVSFYTMGWSGMIIMFLFLFSVILLCLFVIRKWAAFGLETYSLLCATVCLLIFSNFLNRLDVILMLFVYPVLFHWIFTGQGKILRNA